MPAPSMATTAAIDNAASPPSRGGSRDKDGRSTHSSTLTARASHSARPLADTKRDSVRLRAAPASGTRVTTSTTSSARPSIAPRRGSRHRSGIQAICGAVWAMAQTAVKRACIQSRRASISSTQTWWPIG